MKWWGWAAGIVLLGALLRLTLLDLRPMHTDEAVHAVKFGALLETGTYRYDKEEYHGPTLNYFTLLPALVAGQETLADLSETTLRIVPALFGVGLILLILSLRASGIVAVTVAAFLAACSPMMTFYSRYYIQEPLLVFFTMGLIVAAHRFLETGRTRWAVTAGVSAGLMFATKETWVIPIGAMGVSLLTVLVVRRRSGARPLVVRWRRVGLGVAAGIAVSILFFSSFFSNWEGVRDSVLAYQTYIGRAGEGSKHGQPWHYFIRMLMWWHEGPGPVWTEAVIVVFGVIGIIGSLLRGVRTAGSAVADGGTMGSLPGAAGLMQMTTGEEGEAGLEGELRIFLSVYALVMLFLVSVFPYKTPWLILGALLPLIFLAGWGVAGFLHWLPARAKAPGYILLALLGGHLVWQSYLANFDRYDDPANPMVYSHPTDDVRQISDIVGKAARAAPGGMPVQVVVSGGEYWPLPWYLRRLPRVGWWEGINEEFTPTPVILVSPDREQDLLTRLYEFPPPGERTLYVPLFDRPMFLRPGREVRGYITLELSNRMRETEG